MTSDTTALLNASLLARELLNADTMQFLREYAPDLLERLLVPEVVLDDIYELVFVTWGPDRRAAHAQAEAVIQKAARR